MTFNEHLARHPSTILTTRQHSGPRFYGIALSYTLILVAVVCLIVVLRVADREVATSRVDTPVVTHLTTASSEAAAPTAHNSLSVLLLQLVVIVAAAQAFSGVARVLRQPRVIGEMTAGIFLGPSFLGSWFPSAMAYVFPPSSLGSLQLVSQLGIVLYMFVVGIQLNLRDVSRQLHRAAAVSHVSIVVPFCLGTLAALPLYREYAGAGVGFRAFALFVGVAMSVTAFPVLARILDERRLSDTPLGSTALTCAAVDDVTAWVLLIFVIASVRSQGAGAAVLFTLTRTAVFVLIAMFVLRPLLARWLPIAPSIWLPVGLIVALACAVVTERVGIHAFLGAFVAGTVMPEVPELRQSLQVRVAGLGSAVFLPLFFAFTGLRTEIDGIHGFANWGACLGIIAVAVTGKVGGSAIAARLTKASWLDALSLGVLMNTRGLMELMVLNVAYDMGVLSQQAFTALVVMALVTTAMTCPLLDALHRRSVLRPAGVA
jgi:Kef-type K+ transport system membrane component KefB